MEQIFVANPKGGCGKTTISTQIAAYFSGAGKKVLLVDHDALKCSSDWLAGRPSGASRIKAVVAKVGAHIDFGDVDCVVHDMPAAWTLDRVQEILHAGDKVLIPMLSSPNDIKAGLRFIMELSRTGIVESGIELGLVANRVRSNTVYAKTLHGFLSRIDLPLVAELRDTQNYVRAMDLGLSVFDMPPSRVRRDIEQWQPIIEWLTQQPLDQRYSA